MRKSRPHRHGILAAVAVVVIEWPARRMTPLELCARLRGDLLDDREAALDVEVRETKRSDGRRVDIRRARRSHRGPTGWLVAEVDLGRRGAAQALMRPEQA